MDAETIEAVFGVEEVDRIYLNFSDPWPKDRCMQKGGCSSREFLARYAIKILKKDGWLEFKTDNEAFVSASRWKNLPAGWKALGISFHDLHHDDKMGQDNVMTEYEERFSLIRESYLQVCDSERQPINWKPVRSGT